MATLAFGLVGAGIGGAALPALGVATTTAMSYGWIAGTLIGNIFFGPKGPDTQGPRLEDLKVQASTYGMPIPILYGDYQLAGNVIWSTDIIETKNKESIGGFLAGISGGPSGSYTTYTYSVSYATGICEGPIAGVRKIWGDAVVLYSNDINATPAEIYASDQIAVDIRIYLGTSTQDPDPLIESYVGVGQTPAYRDLAYVTLENLQLDKWGNRRPNLLFDVTTTPATNIPTLVHWDDWDHEVAVTTIASHQGWSIVGNEIIHSIAEKGSGGSPKTFSIIELHYSMEDMSLLSRVDKTEDVTVYLPTPSIDSINEVYACTNDSRLVFVRHSDLDQVYGADLKSQAQRLKAYWKGQEQSTVFTVPGWNSLLGLDVAHPYAVLDDSGDGLVYWASFEGVQADQDLIIIAYPASNGVLSASPAYSFRISTLGSPSGDHVNTTLSAGQGYFAYDFQEELFYVDITYPNLSGGKQYLVEFNKKLQLQRVWDITGGNVTGFYQGSVFWDGGFYLGNRTFVTFNKIQRFELPDDGNRVADAGNWMEDKLVDIGPTDPLWDPIYDRTETFNNAYDLIPLESSLAVAQQWGIVSLRPLHGPGGVPLDTVVDDLCDRSGLLSSEYDTTALSSYNVSTVVSQPTAARSVLQNLQMAYFFDAVDTNKQIKFVVRGGSSIEQIPYDNLILSNDNNAILEKRTNDLELPQKISVTAINPDADFEETEQYAEKLITNSKHQSKLSLPIVFTPTQTAQIAEKHLANAYFDRTELQFSIPRDYLKLDPTDVIDLQFEDGLYRRVRISETTLDGQTIIVKALVDDSSAYLSEKIGSDSSGHITDGITIFGSTNVIPLDLPILRGQDDDAGVYVSLFSNSNNWNGGILYKSVDNGASYSQVDSIDANPIIGRVKGAIPSSRYETWDRETTIEVQMIQGIFLSNAESSVINGLNGVAVGGDQRWELLQFADVTTNVGPPVTYTLSNLLRGRLGTEHNVGNHQDGDYIIGLDTAQLIRAAMDIAAYGNIRFLKGVTFGQLVQDAERKEYEIYAECLRPWSPVNVRGTWPTEGFDDCTITWNARSRYNAQTLWRPDESDPNNFTIEILDALDGNVINTYGDTPNYITDTSWLYSKADQLSDGVVYNPSLYVKVYHISNAVGRGNSLSYEIERQIIQEDYSALIVSDTPTHYWKFDETGTPGTISATVGAMTGTYHSGAVLEEPALLNQGTCFKTTNINNYATFGNPNIGNTAFTVECWVKFQSLQGNIFEHDGSAQQHGLIIYFWSSYLRIVIKNTASNYAIYETPVNSILADEIYHIALSYLKDNSTPPLVYINGQLQSLNIFQSGGTIPLNGLSSPDSNMQYGGILGWSDDLSIWLGSALSSTTILRHYEAGVII